MNKKYEVILFDADDTLFDFKHSERNAFHNSFASFGYMNGLTDYRPDYNAVSKVLWNDLEQGRITLQELAVERFRRLFVKTELDLNPESFSRVYLDYLGKESHLVKGALELCQNLSDHRLAIITNGFSAVQTSRIKNSPLCNTFEQIIMSEQVGSQKPDKLIFDVAFSKLNMTDKSKVLIVGDSLTSDMQGGINYGIDTCWFNPHEQENNQAVKPTYEIKQLEDLLSIVTSA